MIKLLSGITFSIATFAFQLSPAKADIPVHVSYDAQETQLELEALRRVENYFRGDSSFRFVSTSNNRLTVSASLLRNVYDENVPLVALTFQLRPAGKDWGQEYIDMIWIEGDVTGQLNRFVFDQEGRIYLEAIFENWDEPSFDQFDMIRENIKLNILQLIRSGDLPVGTFDWLLDSNL